MGDENNNLCTWYKYPDDYSYETTCNNGGWFEEKLKEGIWHFCPYCGKQLKIDNGPDED